MKENPTLIILESGEWCTQPHLPCHSRRKICRNTYSRFIVKHVSLQELLQEEQRPSLDFVYKNSCLYLDEEGKNLYRDIGGLVKKGVLSPQIQRAMDGVRFFGNAAVHPGTINLNDEPNTAITLFELLNLIVEQTISAERKTAELYERIPKSKRDAIARRDGKQDEESNN